MAEFIEISKEWFFSLGEQYGVNPVIFGIIYVGAIPFFTLSIAWLVRNYRKNRSIVMPTLSSVACFVSAYVYLFIAGQNVPWWIYALVLLMVGYGAYSTYRTVRRKINNGPATREFSK